MYPTHRTGWHAASLTICTAVSNQHREGSQFFKFYPMFCICKPFYLGFILIWLTVTFIKNSQWHNHTLLWLSIYVDLFWTVTAVTELHLSTNNTYRQTSWFSAYQSRAGLWLAGGDSDGVLPIVSLLASCKPNSRLCFLLAQASFLIGCFPDCCFAYHKISSSTTNFHLWGEGRGGRGETSSITLFSLSSLSLSIPLLRLPRIAGGQMQIELHASFTHHTAHTPLTSINLHVISNWHTACCALYV